MNARTRRTAALAEPALLAAIAVAVGWDSLSYPGSVVPDAPGPGFFPRLLAGLLVGCALVLLARVLMRPAAASEKEPLGLWRLAGAIAAIAVFLTLAGPLDVLVLLPVLIAVLMLLSGERSKLALVVAPIVFTLFIYVVFVRSLGVALPTRFG